MSYLRGKVKYKLQMDEHEPDHTFHTKHKHLNTYIHTCKKILGMGSPLGKNYNRLNIFYLVSKNTCKIFFNVCSRILYIRTKNTY